MGHAAARLRSWRRTGSFDRCPVLVFGGTLVEDDDDDDGYLEAGETGNMWIYLNNTDGYSDVVDMHGTLTSLTNAVTVNGSNAIAWDYIAPYASRLSTNAVNMTMNAGVLDGTELDFELELIWSDGLELHTNTLLFTYVAQTSSLVTGRVESVVWNEETGEIDTEAGLVPVEGAVVHAEAVNGNTTFSLPSDSNGLYQVSGVLNGDVWFTVTPPNNFPYVAPAGSNVIVANDPQEQNFVMGDYGTNAPLLKLYEVYTYDYGGDADGAIDPGETISVRVSLRNEGATDALSVTGLLAVADMGALGPYMDVTSGNYGPISGIPVSTYYGRTFYFTVNVHPDAEAGDMQRFWMTANDSELVPRVWPFDFALTVAPLYSVSGVVTNAAGAPVPGIPVELAYGDGQGGIVATSVAGEYLYSRIAPGTSNLVVTARAPEGYYLEPIQYTIDVLNGDTNGLNFVLKESLLMVSPTNLSATIREGETTNATLTVENGGDTNLTVDVRVEYRRTRYDVMPPETNPLEPIFALRALDWTQLDADAYVDGEIEVRFADGTGWAERDEILRRHGLRALFHFKLLPACLAVPQASTALSAGEGPAALGALGRSLNADPGILYAIPAAKAKPLVAPTLPDDTFFDQEYGLRNDRQTGGTQGADINVEPVWREHTTGSREIVVAVCDTGFDLNHADLLPNLWSNPLEHNGDFNSDGYPGEQGVDDDGDAQRQLYSSDVVSGEVFGPETVHPLFAPEMWRDSQTYEIVLSLWIA